MVRESVNLRTYPKGRALRSKQAGIGLVELSIAVAVLGVIVFLGLLALIDQSQIKKANLQGEALKALSIPFNEYIVDQNALLGEQDFAGNPAIQVNIDGVPVNIYQPTFAQLVQLGYLDPNALNNSFYDSDPARRGYQFRVRKVDPGCVASIDGSCRLEGFVILEGSVTNFSNQPDYALAGEVAAAAGDGGVTGTVGLGQNAALIYGPNGAWQFPHPLAPAPLAGVAVRVNTDIGVLAQYLRRDGTTFMSGPLQMRDVTQPEAAAPRQDIVGAGDIDASSLLSQGDVNALGDVQGQTITSLSDVNAVNGTVRARSLEITDNIVATNLSATNNIDAGNNITATNQLRSNNDLIVNNDARVGGDLSANDIFLASRGQWLSQVISDFVVIESRLLNLGAVNGGLVTKPTCAQEAKPVAGVNTTGPAGTPLIYAWPVAGTLGSATDVRATIIEGPPDQVIIDNSRLAAGPFNVEAIDLGAQWQLQSTGLIDADGTNYAQNFTVLAQIVCKYN